MTARGWLYKVYWWLERHITPGLKFSQYSYEEALTEEVHPGLRWLDLGCGRRLLPAWRQSEEAELIRGVGLLVGTDPDLMSLKDNRTTRSRVVSDAGNLPFKSESFDLVSANMVVEHLAAPDTQFVEIARIIRGKGRIIFITPNSLGFPTVVTRWFPNVVKRTAAKVLEQRAGQDVFPTYYRLNSARAIREMATRVGLKVVTAGRPLFSRSGPAASRTPTPFRPLNTCQYRLKLKKVWVRYLSRASSGFSCRTSKSPGCTSMHS